MHYLVTGGFGFIGAYLTRDLLAKGHEVTVFDNLTRGRKGRLDDCMDDINHVSGDIRDADSVIAASKGVDGIYHLAAVNGTENFYNFPELVLDVGIRGMLSVMEACKVNNIADLIVASSAEVYQLPPQIPTDETVPLIVPDPLNPRYSYGGSKLISELIALNYGKDHEGRVMIFRPHNVYGADMGWKHVIPQFIMRALEKMEESQDGDLPFPIQGDGMETRAFCHVSDICQGLLILLDKGEHKNIYHIGNSEEVTIRDVAEQVVHALDRKLLLQSSGDVLEGSTPRRCPDISKMQELGYTPKIPLKEGLPGVVEWYRTNRSLQPSDEVLL